MEKFCIFCGNKPDKKNKEHVIPLWLIKMTGNPNRIANFAFVKNPSDNKLIRHFSFDQFTFPACKVCNSKYSELEVKTQRIVSSIISQGKISPRDISTLLDWFDKVRIGLWLGFLYLERNMVGVKPHFYIDDRMGHSDRLLIIEKDTVSDKRINFLGADTLLFAYGPSAFSLRINNLTFTNISYQDLFLRRFGFPFPKNMVQIDSEQYFSNELSNGSNRIKNPPIRKVIAEKGTKLYQPIFKCFLNNEGASEIFNTDYVKDHCLDWDQGLGGIFFENEVGQISYLQEECEIKILPNYIHEFPNSIYNSAVNVHEWQKWIVKNLWKIQLKDKEKEKEQKKHIGFACSFNDLIINHAKEQLKKIKNGHLNITT